MEYHKERDIIIKTVIKAAKLCMNVQKEISSDDSVSKDDKSPVTIADFGSQALLNMQIMESFPGDKIMGEEDSTKLREDKTLCDKVLLNIEKVIGKVNSNTVLDSLDFGTSSGSKTDRFWAIDPIDGTKGFLRKDQYAIAVGLVKNGKVVFGVLGCPNMQFNEKEKGCIFIAVEGQGAYIRSLESDKESKINVSKIKKSSEANVVESVESGHSSHEDSAKIAEILGITKEPFRIDSQCKYAAIARGDAPIYLRIATIPGKKENPWDHAAGEIIVKEAGGKVSDIFAKELDYSTGRKLTNNTSTIVTNGILHKEVLEAAQKVLL